MIFCTSSSVSRAPSIRVDAPAEVTRVDRLRLVMACGVMRSPDLNSPRIPSISAKVPQYVVRELSVDGQIFPQYPSYLTVISYIADYKALLPPLQRQRTPAGLLIKLRRIGRQASKDWPALMTCLRKAWRAEWPRYFAQEYICVNQTTA